MLIGGANRDRTGDLLNAIQALSQLSYSPTLSWLRADLRRGDWIPCPGRRCQVFSGCYRRVLAYLLPTPGDFVRLRRLSRKYAVQLAEQHISERPACIQFIYKRNLQCFHR